MDDLVADTEQLLASARRIADGHPLTAGIDAAAERLAGPLRVAVAGRAKAGKSTLVNAMVGELIAPTDARECTRIVTWYADGVTYRVDGHLADGTVRQLRFDRDDRALRVDLDGLSVEDVGQLRVTWPSARLREISLVDTPGFDSMDEAVSGRTERFLAPGEDRPAPTDAVLYLLRHVHAADVRFLEAFHDDDLGAANPVNAVGVLSRADEIGVGRSDALDSAARIAARWRTDRRMGALVQTVVPVAGLLAEAAVTLRQAEFADLAAVTSNPGSVVDELLVSVDRFGRSSVDVGVPPERRQALLERLGLFGCRTAIDALRTGRATVAGELSDELLRASGFPALRHELTTRFGHRAGLLKARNAILTVRHVADQLDDRALHGEVERVLAGAHEFAEMRVLNAIRRGELELDEKRLASARRLLGEDGLGIAERSGAGADAPPESIRDALVDELDRWQREVEHPLADPARRTAASTIVRTCEGLLAALG
ncbi:MAG: dynamin family protein [Ilumatobacteraceae bacterium]